MKKTFKFLFLLTLFVLMPFINVNAEERVVTSQDELKAALNDSLVDTIVLGNDIQTTEKINILRPVTIDGANHTITYSSALAANWTGIYVLHFYKTTGTIKNIKLTGAEAALNINGSVVTLEGTIDVSGNRVGGIELGQGQAVTDFPDVNMENATIVNTTETSTTPTAWIDIRIDDLSDGVIDSEDSDFDIEGWPFAGAAYLGVRGQTHLFLNRANVPTGADIVDISDALTNNDNVDVDVPNNNNDVKEDNTAKENPNTYDSGLFYILFGIISFIALGYSYTKVTSK